MMLASQIMEILAEGGEMDTREIAQALWPGIDIHDQRMRRVSDTLSNMARRGTVVKMGLSPRYVARVRVWRLKEAMP